MTSAEGVGEGIPQRQRTVQIACKIVAGTLEEGSKNFNKLMDGPHLCIYVELDR